MIEALAALVTQAEFIGTFSSTTNYVGIVAASC